MMKKIIMIVLLLVSFVSHGAEFYEIFDVSAGDFSRLANQVAKHFTEANERDVSLWQQELNYLSEGLAEIESANTNNPVYWFVRGLHARNLGSFYSFIKQPDNVLAQLEAKNNAYQKAMELDKTNEPHLSAGAYAAMKAGLPEKLKQQAIESELNLGGSGENDSYYWYLHWSNINELQKQGRFDDADKALLRMKQELANSGQQASVYNQLVDKAERELTEKKSQQQKPLTETKTAPVREHKAFTEDQVDDEYYRYLLIVGVIMFVLLIIALVFEVRRRKQRK